MIVINQIIKYIGTPRLYAEILGYLDRVAKSGGCFFKNKIAQNNDSAWMVEDAYNISPKKYAYDSFEELEEELSVYFHYSFYDDTQLFVEKELDMETLEFINKLMEIQSLYSVSAEKDMEIAKLTYSMTGIETIMTSLLEPIPTEDLMTILCDAFGELLLSSSALYGLEGNNYMLKHNHGFAEKIETVVKTDKNSSTITFAFPTNINRNQLYPEMEKLNQIYQSLYAIPIQIDEEIRYFILMGRNEGYSDSEKVIINSLSHLASKIIDYQALRMTSREEKSELNRSIFRLEAFYKGLEYLFSIQQIDQFCDNLEDMIKEIFQTSKVSLFVRKSWGNLLWGHKLEDFKQALTIKYNTVWDEYDLAVPNQREAIEDDFGNLKPYFKNLEASDDLPSFASIIRGLDGNILGVLFMYDFNQRDREFLYMVSGMAGLVLELLLAHNDFTSVLHSYEEVMDAFQSANRLYEKIASCKGANDFYDIMKKGLIKHFDIKNMFIAFHAEGHLKSIPETLEEDIAGYFEEYFGENYSDIGIRERANGELLFMLPIPVKSKQVLIAFDGEDNPKLNVLLQLMQLGFQDKLASILEDGE